MRCLVTGASGQLGSCIARYLRAQGACVIALVRPESDLWRLADILDDIEIIRADIAHIEPASAAIIASAPDVVAHVAWFGIVGAQRNDPRQISANVRGSLDLFQISQRAGARCWVGIGSQAEYGPSATILTEETPVRPVTPYGVAKLSVGLLTQQLCALSGMRHLWYRLLAIYGPADDERHFIPAVIRCLLAGERPALTRGDQRWDYLYVEDAAEAIGLGILAPDVQGIFNLGSGETHRVRTIAERIRDLVDPALPLGLGEIPYAADHAMLLGCDITRLSAATGWKPRTTLADGLEHTVRWYRQAVASQGGISGESR